MKSNRRKRAKCAFIPGVFGVQVPKYPCIGICWNFWAVKFSSSFFSGFHSKNMKNVPKIVLMCIWKRTDAGKMSRLIDVQLRSVLNTAHRTINLVKCSVAAQVIAVPRYGNGMDIRDFSSLRIQRTHTPNTQRRDEHIRRCHDHDIYVFEEMKEEKSALINSKIISCFRFFFLCLSLAAASSFVCPALRAACVCHF